MAKISFQCRLGGDGVGSSVIQGGFGVKLLLLNIKRFCLLVRMPPQGGVSGMSSRVEHLGQT